MRKTKTPHISVVIPAYNEARHLPLCLSAFGIQTYRDFELIVVDNNSTDDTPKVARAYGARVVKEPTQGMIPARERGFREARGEIIARTDADSVVAPVWLETIDRIFRIHPHTVAVSGSFSFPETGPLNNFLLKSFTHWFYYGFTKFLIGHYPLSGPNYALRKSAWEQVEVHMDDSLVHEDMDLACHLTPLGEVVFCPSMLTTYSLRRWKRRFLYTLCEYSNRYVKTIFLHHPYLRRHEKGQR